MEATLRQTWAFMFRGYHITRRYIGWVIVFNFYALVTSASVTLIATRDALAIPRFDDRSTAFGSTTDCTIAWV